MDEVEKPFEIIIELPRLTHKAIEIDPHRADRDGGRAKSVTHNRKTLLLVSQLLCAIDLDSVARVSHGRADAGELLL
jgi:hypothetical protein